VALKLLSPDGESAWPVMHKLSQALSDIEVTAPSWNAKVNRACL
jgi:hypothetical protein